MKKECQTRGFMRCLLLAGFSLALVFSFSGVLHAQKEKAVRIVAVITKEELGGALSEPSAIFFDESKKRLYVSDALNNRLVSYDEQ